MYRLEHKNGKLQQVKVLSKAGQKCRLNYAGKSVDFDTQKGKTYVFNGELKAL